MSKKIFSEKELLVWQLFLRWPPRPSRSMFYNPSCLSSLMLFFKNLIFISIETWLIKFIYKYVNNVRLIFTNYIQLSKTRMTTWVKVSKFTHKGYVNRLRTTWPQTYLGRERHRIQKIHQSQKLFNQKHKHIDRNSKDVIYI